MTQNNDFMFFDDEWDLRIRDYIVELNHVLKKSIGYYYDEIGEDTVGQYSTNDLQEREINICDRCDPYMIKKYPEKQIKLMKIIKLRRHIIVDDRW